MEMVGEKVDLVAFFPQATYTNIWELLLQKGCLSKVRVIILKACRSLPEMCEIFLC